MIARRYNPRASMNPSQTTETQRLQKLMAAAGLGSRRAVEQWIHDGRVTVNGQPAKLGDRAGRGDKVCLDGKPIELVGWARRRPGGC